MAGRDDHGRARRRGLGRRTKGATPRSSNQRTLVVGSLVIDRRRHEVRRDGRSIHLTPTECALLCALASHPGKVYRREELLKLVWGSGIFVETRTVDAHMAKLRQKLRSSAGGPAIAETVWGVGYRLRMGNS